jgi:hypothetical protein
VKDLAILIPSWKGHKLLNTCLRAIKSNCVTNYEVFVILNEPENLDIEVVNKYNVTYLASSVNLGTLAVDLAIPLIKGKFKYVANLNSDMVCCPSWDEKLIEYYEKNGCISVSSPAVEYNGGANGLDTLNDRGLPEFEDCSLIYEFSENCKNGKYVFPNVISQRHPIIQSVEDFLSIGGYTGNWSRFDYHPGYTLDFAQPCRLWLATGNRNMVSVGAAPVFHNFSATMKKLPPHLMRRDCKDVFFNEFGFSVEDFKRSIGFNRIVD